MSASVNGAGPKPAAISANQLHGGHGTGSSLSAVSSSSAAVQSPSARGSPATMSAHQQPVTPNSGGKASANPSVSPRSSTLAAASDHNSANSASLVSSGSGLIGFSEKSKTWKMELLMERLRAKTAHHRQLPELSKLMRMTMLEKRFALDAVERSNLQKSLEAMQHCIRITTRSGLVERLESLSRQLGLKFTEDTNGLLFISSDMFYLEIVLSPDGTVLDVKVHHECKIEQQSCAELIECLQRGDIADFTAQLEGLSSIYQLNAEAKLKSKAFVTLQAMETDLQQICAHEQRGQPDAALLLRRSPVGVVLPRRGGHPMRLVYFVSPYDLLDGETCTMRPLTAESLGASGPQTMGHSVTVHLEASVANKLPLQPLVVCGGGEPFATAPMNAQNSIMLPATFVLRLSKPMPLALALLRQIQQAAEQPTAAEPLLALITRQAGAPSGVNALYVALPGENHCYLLLDGDSLGGAMVSSVPFTEIGQVSVILRVLRKQALFNTIVLSCVRSCNAADIKNVTMFELNALSVEHINVSLAHPFNETLATVDFRLADAGVTCQIESGDAQADERHSERLSRVAAQTLSIPVSLRALIGWWKQDYDRKLKQQETETVSIALLNDASSSGIGSTDSSPKPQQQQQQQQLQQQQQTPIIGLGTDVSNSLLGVNAPGTMQDMKCGDLDLGAVGNFNAALTDVDGLDVSRFAGMNVFGEHNMFAQSGGNGSSSGAMDTAHLLNTLTGGGGNGTASGSGNAHQMDGLTSVHGSGGGTNSGGVNMMGMTGDGSSAGNNNKRRRTEDFWMSPKSEQLTNTAEHHLQLAANNNGSSCSDSNSLGGMRASTSSSAMMSDAGVAHLNNQPPSNTHNNVHNMHNNFNMDMNNMYMNNSSTTNINPSAQQSTASASSSSFAVRDALAMAKHAPDELSSNDDSSDLPDELLTMMRTQTDGTVAGTFVDTLSSSSNSSTASSSSSSSASTSSSAASEKPTTSFGQPPSKAGECVPRNYGPSSVSITPIHPSGGESGGGNLNSVLNGLERRLGIEIIPFQSTQAPTLKSSITITPINAGQSSSSSSSSANRKCSTSSNHPSSSSASNRRRSDERSSSSSSSSAKKSDKKRKRNRDSSPMGPPEKNSQKSGEASTSSRSAFGHKSSDSPGSPSGMQRKYSNSPVAGKSSSSSSSSSSKHLHSPVASTSTKTSAGLSSPKPSSSSYSSASPKTHASTSGSGKPSMSALKSAAHSPSTKDKSKSSASQSSSSSSSKDRDRDRERSALKFSSGSNSPKSSKSSSSSSSRHKSTDTPTAAQMLANFHDSNAIDTSKMSASQAAAAIAAAASKRKGSLSAVIDKLKSAQHGGDESSSSSSGSTAANSSKSTNSSSSSEYMVKPSSEGIKLTINKTRSSPSHGSPSTSTSFSSAGKSRSSSSGNGSSTSAALTAKKNLQMISGKLSPQLSSSSSAQKSTAFPRSSSSGSLGSSSSGKSRSSLDSLSKRDKSRSSTSLASSKGSSSSSSSVARHSLGSGSSGSFVSSSTTSESGDLLRMLSIETQLALANSNGKIFDTNFQIPKLSARSSGTSTSSDASAAPLLTPVSSSSSSIAKMHSSKSNTKSTAGDSSVSGSAGGSKASSSSSVSDASKMFSDFYAMSSNNMGMTSAVNKFPVSDMHFNKNLQIYKSLSSDSLPRNADTPNGDPLLPPPPQAGPSSSSNATLHIPSFNSFPALPNKSPPQARRPNKSSASLSRRPTTTSSPTQAARRPSTSLSASIQPYSNIPSNRSPAASRADVASSSSSAFRPGERTGPTTKSTMRVHIVQTTMPADGRLSSDERDDPLEEALIGIGSK